MADPQPQPPDPPRSDHWPHLLGALVTLIWAGLAGAILFLPRAEGITDAIVQQILTASTGGWMLFLGWLYGSSAGSRAKDAAIAGIAAAKQGEQP